ncbi:hypothetical protein [Variovorax sp. Sphag1AA]|uniref:hypothetical protein n=1 Tax=Variovorax sp. Sphag1AA TaxID=2587027 RepID=UPI0016124A7B|nr:hypothetical protein [Variovorax sp. Sphag1AA]MBB3182049.1 hypothetical protein [Variovorax sp. Sphag1AA]
MLPHPIALNFALLLLNVLGCAVLSVSFKYDEARRLGWARYFFGGGWLMSVQLPAGQWLLIQLLMLAGSIHQFMGLLAKYSLCGLPRWLDAWIGATQKVLVDPLWIKPDQRSWQRGRHGLVLAMGLVQGST